MLVKTTRLMIVLLGIVVCVRHGIAGTWIDDFSDLNNHDWGPIPAINKFSDGEFSIDINEGYFEFRGKKQNANLSLRNWNLGGDTRFFYGNEVYVQEHPIPGGNLLEHWP